MFVIQFFRHVHQAEAFPLVFPGTYPPGFGMSAVVVGVWKKALERPGRNSCGASGSLRSVYFSCVVECISSEPDSTSTFLGEQNNRARGSEEDAPECMKHSPGRDVAWRDHLMNPSRESEPAVLCTLEDLPAYSR